MGSTIMTSDRHVAATANQEIASDAEQLQMSDGTPAESYIVQVRTAASGQLYLHVRLRAAHKQDETHCIPIGDTNASSRFSGEHNGK